MNAVQTFNNPLTMFKTETFIVLMVIAWMYLLHAYYRSTGVDYRYYDQGPKRNRYHRTKAGAFKYWELERCINDSKCPLDRATKSNLRFLIGLRHEIEHHQSAGVDHPLSGRYLACCLNFERAITELFGSKHSLESELSYALQFRELTSMPPATEASEPLPANVSKYLNEFDSSLPDDEFQSPHFSYRLLFTRKLTSKKGQADKAIEFIAADSDLAKTIDKQYWVQKEVEKPKHLPSAVVKLMKGEGYVGFSQYRHTLLWKSLDAKNLGKGYGTQIANTWYWYDRWLEVVRQHCEEHPDKYGRQAV